MCHKKCAGESFVSWLYFMLISILFHVFQGEIHLRWIWYLPDEMYLIQVAPFRLSQTSEILTFVSMIPLPQKCTCTPHILTYKSGFNERIMYMYMYTYSLCYFPYHFSDLRGTEHLRGLLYPLLPTSCRSQVCVSHLQSFPPVISSGTLMHHIYVPLFQSWFSAAEIFLATLHAVKRRGKNFYGMCTLLCETVWILLLLFYKLWSQSTIVFSFPGCI